MFANRPLPYPGIVLALITAAVLLVAGAVLAVNILVDIAYLFIDPRVRLD